MAAWITFTAVSAFLSFSDEDLQSLHESQNFHRPIKNKLLTVLRLLYHHTSRPLSENKLISVYF